MLCNEIIAILNFTSLAFPLAKTTSMSSNIVNMLSHKFSVGGSWSKIVGSGPVNCDNPSDNHTT